MTKLAQDVLYAIRGFRKAPVFSAVAVVSLALGIGANTAIFTLVDQLILRLLPVQDPGHIVLLRGRGRHYGGNNGMNALSYPMYQDLRDRNQAFSAMMCRYRLSFAVGIDSETEVVNGELVSGNYFPLLGVHPALGRLFTARDDLRAGAGPYAVLSYTWWKMRFAGDPHILGQTIRVNDYPLTVVGVAQPGFDGMEPGLPAFVFVPITMAAAVRPGFTDMYDRRQRWVNVYGRLKPGMTLERARAGLQPLFHQIIDSEVTMPAFRHATPYDKQQFLRMWLDAMPGSQGNTNLRREYEKPLWVLMGVVGLVLLIACANLASLLTARAGARQKEIAIRLAMGASRPRMLQQLLTESVLLAVAGGVAGIGLAVLMVKGLLAFLPTAVNGYAISSSPDWRMLTFTFGLSLFTGIGFGLVPALQSTNPDIAPTLKEQAGNIMGGGAQVAFRKVLVSAQVMLSLLLLIGAGLFTRSLSNLHTLDPGFKTANLIQFMVNPRAIGYDQDRAAAFYKRLDERLRRIPGVRDAGYGQVPVLMGWEWDNWVTIDSYPRKGEPPDPHMNSVSASYFATLGIPILQGRAFTAQDDRGAPRVAIVNATFAKKYFGNGLAVGHRFGRGSDPGTPMNIEIVGVAGDTRYESLRDEIPPEVYLCDAQQDAYNRTIYVRTARDPENTFGAIRAAVRELEPSLPVTYMMTLDRQLDDSLVTERMIAALSTVFGILATVLAIVGLYGVMAYMVTRRSREIGIRMALGAQSSSVVWLVMREVLVLVAAGVAAGLPAALALSKVVTAQLYAVQPNDPLSLAAATLLLAGVALVAGYVPARRAAGYDPVLVLRYE
jgi:putative ABC transport system permease protein